MIKLKDLEKYDTLLDVQRSDINDIEYEIRWDKINGYFCTCPGFQGNKKTCKHILRYTFKVNIGELIPNAQTVKAILDIAKIVWKGII